MNQKLFYWGQDEEAWGVGGREEGNEEAQTRILISHAPT